MNAINRYDGEFTVVLLDDEPGLRDAVRKDLLDLRPHYWSVIETSDSDDCLTTVASLDQPPDVVVIDEVLLPGDLKGHEVIKALLKNRGSGAAVPLLVMLSGRTTPAKLLAQNVASGKFMHKSDYSGPKLVETIDDYFRQNVPGSAYTVAIGRWFYHIVRECGRTVDDAAVHCVNVVEQEVRRRVTAEEMTIHEIDDVGCQLIDACLDKFGAK